MTQIAFMGLGAMGSRMAGKLIEAGHEVTVWNRSPGAAQGLGDNGARVAKTPREAADGTQAVFSMLRDDAASRDVWDHPETGAIAGLAKGALAIECSTLTVQRMRTLGDAIMRSGAMFLDAPVAGSRPQADAGALIFLVGGSDDAVLKATPFLDAMGSAIKQCGPNPGDGTTMKLIVNALLGIQVAACAELLAMGDALGIEPEQAADILGDIPVTSPAAKAMMALMVAGKKAPNFPVELVEKDFANILAAASGNPSQVPVSEAAMSVYRKALAAGLGDLNITAVADVYSHSGGTGD